MKYNMYHHRQNVLELQNLLRLNHLFQEGGGPLVNPDGFFDINTTNAIKLFQQENGMNVTGEVDYPTWILLTENAAVICDEVHCTPAVLLEPRIRI